MTYLTEVQLEDNPDTRLNTTGTVGGHMKTASSVHTGADQRNYHEDTTELVDIQVAAGVMNSTVLLEECWPTLLGSTVTRFLLGLTLK